MGLIVDFSVDLEKIGYALKTRIKTSRKLRKEWEKNVDSCIETSRTLIHPKGIYNYFRCEVKNGYLILNEDEAKFHSSFLARRFKNARWVALFVVTIGSELEKRIKNTENRQKKNILDLIGSETAEETANQMQELIENEKDTELVRYSPGMNEARTTKSQDWSVRDQTIIFKLLLPKKIGVRLTKGCMMIPRKSISGIIGQKT